MTAEPLQRWEGVSAAGLAREWAVPRVHLFAQVGSTNDLAREYADEGATAGTVVLAEEQLLGRGRAGRPWASPPGLGLWFSLVLRPADLREPGLLPLVVGCAAARALDGFTRPAVTEIKWPNDIWLGGRKLGGILCEGAWQTGGVSFIVVGIGLNILHLPDDFPAPIRPLATSVRIGSGWAPPRAEIAGAVIREVLHATADLQAMRALLAAELPARDALRGRRVRVVDEGGGVAGATGVASGVAPDGALLLRRDGGALLPVRAGSVQLLDRLEPGDARHVRDRADRSRT